MWDESDRASGAEIPSQSQATVELGKPGEAVFGIRVWVEVGLLGSLTVNATTTTSETTDGCTRHREQVGRALSFARENAGRIGRRYGLTRGIAELLPAEAAFERGDRMEKASRHQGTEASRGQGANSMPGCLGALMPSAHPIVEKILAALPAWAHREMARPHVMRLVDGAERAGLGEIDFVVEVDPYRREGTRVRVFGRDADGVVRENASGIGEWRGVDGEAGAEVMPAVCPCCGRGADGVVVTGESVSPLRGSADSTGAIPGADAPGNGLGAPAGAEGQGITITSEATAREFAGIRVPADAKWAKGGAA